MLIIPTHDSESTTTSSTEFIHTSDSLNYAITHVFLPAKLPDESDYTAQRDLSLTRAVCAAAHVYSVHTPGTSKLQWNRITRMLDSLQASVQLEIPDGDYVISQLQGMRTGDVLAFLIRHHSSAIVLTKREGCMLFQSFEVSSPEDATEDTAEGTAGTQLCSYPELSIKIPSELLESGDFQSELAGFLSRSSTLNSDLPSSPLVHAQYMTTLFPFILRGVSCTTDVPRIVKHVRGDLRRSGGDPAKSVWRRSFVWLLMRIAIQISLDRSLGRTVYKEFMLFFICTIARDPNTAALSTHLLHLIAAKIIRRLSKFGPSIPDWLSQVALQACAGLREILDARWMRLDIRPSLFRNPSQDELVRDTQLTLEHSREYIRNALENHPDRLVATPFDPSHRRRGTLQDFLSSNGSFFDEAYDADPDVTLYDVEKSVEQGIDDFVACVTNVDEASAQLEILMDKYMMEYTTKKPHNMDPEGKSIMLLTGIELFVALDKLVVEKVPILADYIPEVPIALLEKLLLRKTTSIHRLACAYQYLSARYSQSRSARSVLSNDFSEDSFPVRYYAQSLHHQQLKGRIEEDAMSNCDGKQGDQEYPSISQSPLPALPLHAKVVVFELQCPPCIRIWRSAAARIWNYACNFVDPLHGAGTTEAEENPLSHEPILRRYFVDRDGPPLHVQFQFADFYPGDSPSQNGLSLLYAVRHPLFAPGRTRNKGYLFSTWTRQRYHENHISICYSIMQHRSRLLGKYTIGTSHTSNDVLAAQADCPTDLSLDEFIAFGQLRSGGGSLQWINILLGLHSRTLNLRRFSLHCLLAQAVFQVGPLDLNTGLWIWHQDLHEPSFCNALLDELGKLFVEMGAGSIDAVVMGTISLLLTRVLASSPSEGVSERVIALVRRVRRKTFNWVQELLYNVVVAPTDDRRSTLLKEMAATCRSTFDVDPATLNRLCHSAEDVDALISCALFIHALRSSGDAYLQLLSARDCHLSPTLDGILRDIILADFSDYGIDFAIAKTFTIHKPSVFKWEQSHHHSNSRWLTCKINPTKDRPSQIIYLNLLSGEVRADGQQVGILSWGVDLNDDVYQHIFRGQGFFVIPSDLPGMDFTTLVTASNYKIHWAGRGDSLVIRARCSELKDILELIPGNKLKKDLPPELVNNCVHWLNVSTRIIEIRPLERLWEESSDNWRIDCSSEQYRAYKGQEIIVDIRSPTWEMIWKCFGCLNNVAKAWSNDLLVTTSPVESSQPSPVLRLSVTLPRYGLSFFVNAQGEFESTDFKDMVYDENQCIRALPGLENILVLRQTANHVEGLIHRRILVPSGVLRKHGNHHFQVVRDNEQGGILHFHQSHHSYQVDTDLGCLVGNGTSKSTGYLAHLHATTNCDWPDPHNGRTGTQAALYLFRSAGFQSIMRYHALDISSVWTSSRYPQIKSVLMELQRRYHWDRDMGSHKSLSELLDRRVTGYPEYQSWLPAGSSNSADCNRNDGNNFTARLSEEPGLPTLIQVTYEQLFVERPAPRLPPRTTLLHDTRNTRNASSENIPELNRLFSTLPTNKFSSPFQQEYVALLENSSQFVRETSRMTHSSTRINQMDELERHYTQCRANYLGALTTLEQRLGPTAHPYEQALYHFGQWPPVKADILLRCLASTSPFKLSGQWKKCLISLALLLLDLQRARRLLLFALDGREEELENELENEGCDGWDPEEFPDWLLIQIEGNFLVRRAQIQTVMAMMLPQSDENTVMQVNIGEGKSSVIIPIIAAALANGKQLVRVIVPKALMVQMFEILVSRLGGLANRPIYHRPFSRSPECDDYGRPIDFQFDDLQELMTQCIVERGILLVQPEHVASLKLKCIEEQISKGGLAAGPLQKLREPMIYKHIKTALLRKQLSKDSLVGDMLRSLSRPSEREAAGADYHNQRGGNARDEDSASKWLSLHKWIHSHVRDILDESDESLRPQFQLIYSMGHQQHMDGYPDRWTIIQQVLRLVKECADTLSRNHPNSMEYKRGPPGSFPHVHIVRGSDVGRRLIPMIVQHVMAGRLPSIIIQDIVDPALQDAVRSFISDKHALQVPNTVKMVEEYAKRSDQSCTWNGLLLLRGLLTSNILLFALTERRWRVDYGLDLTRSRIFFSHPTTLLAVPYRAKDVPAPNTQFGHPDITIILTCLSYYYGGLTEEQLRATFEILLDEDDPTKEYTLWVKDYDDGKTLDSLRKLTDISLNSSEQWDNVIFPHFSRSQAAIDFYLSRVVFPREAKEYPLKLVASSWDLAEKRENPITGFSGTDDNRWLLPMSITQHTLDHQRGTSARLLAYLLRSENDCYMTINQDGERRTTLEFLQMVARQQPEIHVFLDVGAQILDLSNVLVAEAWLNITHRAAGAIYFNDYDELVVLMRNGSTVPLLSSSLSQQLDRCVVYLDHAHTRGTDLKLPVGSRAAVTLGPKLTKDRLVQGCMRMRKLGRGHSVMFFAPPEVDWSIRAVTGKKDPNIRITTVDILCWAIHETWTDIEQQAPHWAQQGMDRKRKNDAWSRFCNKNLTAEQLSSAWLQGESKSLEDLYAPHESKHSFSSLSTMDPGIQQRCKFLGVLSLPTTHFEEEQEREVNHEKEREREAELPPKAEPAEHIVHEEVVAFVKTGVIPQLHNGSAFRPVFTTLERSSATTLEADVWSPFILATTDFCNTVKLESTQGTMDQYLRPVQWVLSSKKDCGQLLVLPSPFEVGYLMSDIRSSEHVHLHVYAPRTSQRMNPCDDLKLYSIPPLPPNWAPPWALIDQLNMFAGQLYLRDYTSYLRLCHFLGVPTKELPKDGTIRRNLFEIPGSFEENEIMFCNSPLPSVMALLAIRTRGRPFAHTHMGKILHGRPLTVADFAEPRSMGPHDDTIICNTMETSPSFSSETIPPSLLDMECDSEGYPGPYEGSLPSSKRNLEAAGISSADSEQPHKRLRSD